jgi:hypothetical protein
MRFVRIFFGLLSALVGLLVTIVGAAAAFWLVGPDNTVDTGELQLASKGLAVMTTPDLLDRHGPTLHVTAKAADGWHPIFVGVGNDLDVASYLGTSQHTKVVRLAVPVKLDTQEFEGGLAPLAAPAGLDWWVAKDSGNGSQSIAWPIADGRYDVVVMNADGKPGTNAQVNLGVELDGAFVTSLLVLGAGLVLLVVGLLLMFRRRRRPDAPEPLTSYGPPAQYAPPAYQGQGQGQGQWQGPGQGQGPGQWQGQGHGQGPSPVRRVAVVATAASVLLAATGCVAVPERNTGQSQSRPAVTIPGGQAVVKKYNEINNKANQARDEKLSETIEGDPVLGLTRAGFKISRATDASGKHKVKPFTYPKPQIGSPQFSAYPMRFVAASDVSTDKTVRQLGVWERQSAGSPWLLTYSVYPSATMKLPSMDGLRLPAKADWGKLSTLPKTAAENLAQYFTAGVKSPKAAAFVPSPGTTSLLTGRAKSKVADAKLSYISTAADTFRVSGEPLTFFTKSGEALVFLALSEQYLQRITPGSNAYWTRGAVTAFSSQVKYTQGLTQDYVQQVALVIPLKGKGKIRILSVDGDLVGAGGY